MYKIGEKIVHPLYGAGVIESLEEKDVDGIVQTYYVLQIPVGNLKIMISAAKAGAQGIREIHPKDEIVGIVSSVIDAEVDMPDNWNQRYKENMERIKSGQLPEVSLVYRNLLLRERERGLSTAEKKLMTTAKQIILSELILSKDIDRTDAETLLESIFG
ncbi:MAG: CarD family transcriptional regulator [Defluviitaleaceae bacterium]|nr:CarD family transcriptional regulator [Defluviitaleaceae bacterium]